MNEIEEEKTEEVTFFAKLKRLATGPGKNAFWLWIAYQCIKGTLTTTFIWVPLLYVWFHH